VCVRQFGCREKNGEEGHRTSLTLWCTVKPPMKRRALENIGAERSGAVFLF
jgi:hypothetical protein